VLCLYLIVSLVRMQAAAGVGAGAAAKPAEKAAGGGKAADKTLEEQVRH
jgi:hypothetical protein